LTTSQRRKCKRDPGMPQVLTEATHIAAAECQHQFRDERWNCSNKQRSSNLRRGAFTLAIIATHQMLCNRETAFLFSISSAGLTHAVARACANGHLKRCSCDDSYDSHVTDGSWRWDGCGDNVHYAAKFVRRFLKSRSTSRDIRAEVDKHNSDLGIRVVKSNVKVTCKCHGVSGSCTTKTCWRKMAPFYEIGRKIKRARLNLVANTYRTTTPRATLNPREELKGEIPRNKELVYLEKSPTYCRKSRYSKGTKGRVCKDERSCDKVCCGRGYTTHVRLVRRSCQCEVKWCCAVHCNTCSERKKIHTCK
uniref:Protein Wnt n=1 Tax=Ciona savignyi TaxID=51511 RepID=H2Y6S2_CIOSA